MCTTLTGGDVLVRLAYILVCGRVSRGTPWMVRRGLPEAVAGHAPRLDERPARPLSAAADVSTGGRR
jgi:hypothetical protein